MLEAFGSAPTCFLPLHSVLCTHYTGCPSMERPTAMWPGQQLSLCHELGPQGMQPSRHPLKFFSLNLRLRAEEHRGMSVAWVGALHCAPNSRGLHSSASLTWKVHPSGPPLVPCPHLSWLKTTVLNALINPWKKEKAHCVQCIPVALNHRLSLSFPKSGLWPRKLCGSSGHLAACSRWGDC